MTWILSHHRTGTSADQTPSASSIPIPECYVNLELTKCPPTKLEQEFAKKFPGRIETYHHAGGMLILRQVKGATRKLHNTSTCLRASGFKLTPRPPFQDKDGKLWQTYKARNAKNQLVVKSVITDEHGKSWSTVEDWFWHALFASPTHSYLAISDIRAEPPY